MKIDKNTIIKVSVAAICGIAAFSISYWALSLILQPIDDYLDKRMKGGN